MLTGIIGSKRGTAKQHDVKASTIRARLRGLSLTPRRRSIDAPRSDGMNDLENGPQPDEVELSIPSQLKLKAEREVERLRALEAAALERVFEIQLWIEDAVRDVDVIDQWKEEEKEEEERRLMMAAMTSAQSAR